MGGHGGLNILPQKKWNVYNWDNRIKVMNNEKTVRKEIDRMKLKHRDKTFTDKINLIKHGHTDQKISLPSEEYDESKIFKEVMQRESISKRINTQLKFEKMSRPMRPDEQLKLVDEEEMVKNEKECEGVKQITFKESIKRHLSPWYMKKRMEDYNIPEVKKVAEEKAEAEVEEMRLLKKKHRKEKSEGKDKSSSGNLEILRKERECREKEEHMKIMKFLNKNTNAKSK